MISKVTSPLKFGLIGKSLQHSFSKKFFETEWTKRNVIDRSYELLELAGEKEVEHFLNQNDGNYQGLNVTIPYKVTVFNCLSEYSNEAAEIGAINCLKNNGSHWIGHNTDGPAFLNTIQDLKNKINRSLILGDGGASKAVQWAMRQLDLNYDIVSRKGKLTYDNLRENWNGKWNFIIQTTPVGMYPNIDQKLEIPFEKFHSDMIVYDLIYNPIETTFLKDSRKLAALTINGLQMLEEQARLSYFYWTGENI